MTTRRWADRREALWEPRKGPLLFFAAAYAIGISVNLISNQLAGYRWAGWAIGLGVPAALLALILSPLIRRIWPQRRPEAFATVHPAGRCRGLVVLASAGAGIATARAAVVFHAPDLERVWILHSDASGEAARSLVGELCREPRFTIGHFELIRLSNPEFGDPERVRQALEKRVFAELPAGMEPADVVIDITGGAKTTTVGAFLVGLPRGRRLEVVPPEATDERLRGTAAGSPLEIALDYKLKVLKRR